MSTKYYVSPSGSNTSPYDTWAKAANSIQTAVNLALLAGDIVEIDGGISGQNYVENVNGVVNTGVLITGSNESGHDGEVSITGSGDEAFEVSNAAHSNYILRKVRLISDGAFPAFRINTAAANTIFEDVIVDGKGLTHYVLSAGNVFRRTKLRGLGDSVNGISVEIAGSSLLLEACAVVYHDGFYAGAIRLRDASTVTINRCYLDGAYSNFAYLQNSALSVLNFTNNTCGSFNNSGYSVPVVINNAAGGTVNENNNTFTPDSYRSQDGYGIVPDATDVIDTVIGAVNGGASHAKGGIFFTVDDGNNYAFASSIASVCAARGAKMSWYIDWIRFITAHPTEAEQSAILREFTNAGHEIGVHGWSNSLWTATEFLTATGSGTTPTIDVDVSADTITCTDIENGAQVVSSFSAKTVGVIVGEINAFTNWSCIIGSDGIGSNAKGSSVADTGGPQAAGAGYICLLDLTGASQGYYKAEFSDTKAIIESRIGGGYTVKSARPVGFQYNSACADAIRDAGIYGMSSVPSSSFSTRQLRDIDIYDCNAINTTSPTVVGAVTEDDWNNVGRGIAQAAVGTGVFWVFLTHNATEFSPEQVGWMLDGANEVEDLQQIALGDMFEHVQTSGLWTDTGGDQRNWTRSIESTSFDPSPSNSSRSSIANGVKDWSTGTRPTGMDGEPYPDTHVDVGCVQSKFNARHPANL